MRNKAVTDDQEKKQVIENNLKIIKKKQLPDK